jgi:hypothetical protein
VVLALLFIRTPTERAAWQEISQLLSLPRANAMVPKTSNSRASTPPALAWLILAPRPWLQ